MDELHKTVITGKEKWIYNQSSSGLIQPPPRSNIPNLHLFSYTQKFPVWTII